MAVWSDRFGTTIFPNVEEDKIWEWIGNKLTEDGHVLSSDIELVIAKRDLDEINFTILDGSGCYVSIESHPITVNQKS